MRFIFYLISILFFGLTASAYIGIGGGFSSFTSGQTVPAVLIEIDSSAWSFDATATGVSSKYDFLSGYSGSLYRKSEWGKILGQSLVVGFGGGAYYSVRGFRASTSGDTNDKSDYGLGPAFFVSWNPGQIFFIRVQSILGIGHANNIGLYFQDVSQLSVGLKW